MQPMQRFTNVPFDRIQYKNGFWLISIKGLGMTNPFLKNREPAPPMGMIK